MKSTQYLASLAVATCAAMVMMSGSAFAQVGRYYLTDESGLNQVWQFQGGGLVSNFATVPAGSPDGPIIVDGNTLTVRSVKGGFVGGSAPVPGSEYNFAGVPLGPLSLDFSAHPGYGRVIDAAFDGQNTYIVAGLGGAAGVFQYNADFSGPGTLVFNIPGAPENTAQGITYDTRTNTIWTSDYDFTMPVNGGMVRQWDPNTGLQMAAFPVMDNLGNASERNTALAYDVADDTFWMNAHVEDTMGLGYGIGELWQFDRAGNFLQKIHGAAAGGPTNILYWGGEIYTVPEPGSIVLAAIGLIGLAAWGWRRKR